MTLSEREQVASGYDMLMLQNAGMDGSPQVSSEIILMDGGVIKFNHQKSDVNWYKSTINPDYKRPGPFDLDYED